MTTLNKFQLGQFSLCIPQGRHEPSGHILLEHGTRYTLRLHNASERRCDVRVTIDGMVVGCWRVPAGAEIELERPANDDGRFTFYRLGSRESIAAGLVANDALGLVTVTFMPEKISRFTCVRFSPARGGTGLSGHSDQQFATVAPLDRDDAAFVTIFARLYCTDTDIRPLQDVAWQRQPAPLPPRPI